MTELFEQAGDAVLKRAGLRRRHWHVLAVLRSGPLDRAQITEALLGFWVAASITQTDVVDDLVRRDWVATDGSRYELTEAGAAAVARISAGLAELDSQALAGIDPATLEVSAAVLRSIETNLTDLLAR